MKYNHIFHVTPRQGGRVIIVLVMRGRREGRPLHRVEVGRAVVAAHGVEQVVQHADAHAAAALAHRRHHAPLVGLGVVALHTGDGVATAPAPHCRGERGSERVNNIRLFVRTPHEVTLFIMTR